MSKKEAKDPNVKTFSITDYMMADLMFFLRPFKERQQEMLFWSRQLSVTQDDIIRGLGLDPAKYSVDWPTAYKTGKLICTKLPEPKPVVEEKKEGDKNGGKS